MKPMNLKMTLHSRYPVIFWVMKKIKSPTQEGGCNIWGNRENDEAMKWFLDRSNEIQEFFLWLSNIFI